MKDTLQEFKEKMDYHPDVYKANFIDFIKRNDGKEDEDDKDKSQL